MDPQTFLPHVDEIVMEYLLFRGFTKSFQVFCAERKRDRTKGFDVDQVMSQLFSHIHNYQIEALMESWRFFKARFFNHLDASHAATVQSLGLDLRRVYVVNTIKTGHRDKALEFFKLFMTRDVCPVLYANQLYSEGDAWARWFMLPYLPSPETDPYFRVFFGKDWLDAFASSLRNFLSLIFRNLPLPKILAFQLTRLEDPSLQLRLKVSQSECNRLRLFNTEATEKIRQLEESGRHLHSLVRVLVQHAYADSMATPSGDVASSSSSTTSSSTKAPSAVLSLTQLKKLSELFGPPEPTNADQAKDNSSIEDTRKVLEGLDATSTNNNEHQSTEGKDIAERERSTRTLLPTPAVSAQGGDHTKTATLLRHFSSGSTEQAAEQTTTSMCAFSFDGQYMAMASVNQLEIVIWATDAVVSAPIHTIKLASPFRSLDWAASESLHQVLVYGLANGGIYRRNVDDKSDLNPLFCDQGMYVNCMRCARGSPFAARALSYIDNGSTSSSNSSASRSPNRPRKVLEIWNLVSGAVKQSYFGIPGQDQEEIVTMCWSKSSQLIVSGWTNGVIKLFDMDQSQAIWQWKAHANQINSVAFAPDEQSVVSVAKDESDILQWSVVSCLHQPHVNGAESRDPTQLGAAPAIVCRYKSMKFTSCRQRRMRFHPSGRFFVVPHPNQSVSLYRTGVRQPICEQALQVTSQVTCIDWHSVLPTTCIACENGSVSIWNWNGLLQTDSSARHKEEQQQQEEKS